MNLYLISLLVVLFCAIDLYTQEKHDDSKEN